MSDPESNQKAGWGIATIFISPAWPLAFGLFAMQRRLEISGWFSFALDSPSGRSIGFCSYFVEHRDTSELGSGIIPARPSYPTH